MDRAVKSGVWEKIPGRSLSECILGVVGVGKIGKAVIRRARAFGMKLLGNDIIPIDPVFLSKNKVEMTSLEDFEIEPLTYDSPLTKMDNVLLASHNANSSPKAWERVHQNTINNLLQGLGLSINKEK